VKEGIGAIYAPRNSATKEGKLAILSRLRLFYLLYFSKPHGNRPLYRAIHRRSARKIVELGVGDGRRACRMIEVARRRSSGPTEVHYVGLDPFEGGSQSSFPSRSLKQVHRLLRGTGARVQLVPGNSSESLIRMANSLGKVDVLIVPAELDSAASARLWFFVPRMLHEQSQVFVAQVSKKGEPVLSVKRREEIDRLAAAGAARRAA
jgi:hypothetical protein